MPSHLFVVNPAAGKANARPLGASITAVMDSLPSAEYAVEYTGHKGHAAEMVSALDGSEWRVYACGGDGTLNEVLAGAAGRPNIAVTHFPCGTGNDFIKSFGARAFADLNALVRGSESLLDCIEVDGGGSRFTALNICSVGIDADVAAEMSRFKWISPKGKAPYNLSLVYNTIKGIHRPYKVELDGKPMDGDYCMLTACNGTTYGGGFQACPDAVPNDGALEFLLVKKMSRMKLARITGPFAAGKYAELSDVITHIRGERISFQAEKPVNINYDGEIFQCGAASFSLSPHKIRFIVPDGALVPSRR